ncbi:MAG: polysaccharide deacetylase family protein, partial [Clostridia bacterium]|nr:polysaccharide deacetylase family protein [Clostridia bacterium]
MKIFKFLLGIVIALSLTVGKADAISENERINWFYKTTGENTRPDILGGNLPKGIENALYIGKEGSKTVYLTFDAGYSNENVESILDTLKKN